MKRFFKSALVLLVIAVSFSVDAGAKKKVVESKTTYAKDVLQPYVDSGQLPGAVGESDMDKYTGRME